jgi:flagellar biosynthesis/type III secretory pathway chaperone
MISSSSGNYPLRRRRSSKGTIAGFAGQTTKSQSEIGASEASSKLSSDSHNASASSLNSGSGTQPQHVVGDSSPASGPNSSSNRPSHAAKLSLMCCQNAIRMGARTQLGLCPPGRARRTLQAALRQKTRAGRASALARKNPSQQTIDTSGLFGLDRMLGEELDYYNSKEEEFLLGANNNFDVESDEEASSGDEDDLNDLDELLKEDAPALDDEKKYSNLREPLFTPIVGEGSGGGQMIGGGMGSGKLPFNRRKLRFFDTMNAPDTMTARAYLNKEMSRSKQRETLLLSKHLRRMQRQQRRRIKQERGEPLDDTDLSDQEDEKPQEKALLEGVTKFSKEMTPNMAAALIVESLSMNSLESVEGMAKCYEGIVAAGVALLESSSTDPTSPLSNTEKPHPRRSEITAALAPLLITSLEQASGEVILALAKLRRMCGTVRYQRRFVQRIAPSLIRPPNGAMWCLRHQNDMEPILAAAELIFDSASEIFSKGWYERGQLLLADSKRAETLNNAAMQLRNLSSENHDALTLGLGGHSGWRSNKYKAGAMDGSKSASEPLAEWEVIAVDRQIRVSISNIISMDWSRVVVHSKENDMSKSYHRSRSSAANKRPTVLTHSLSGENMSPAKGIASAQMSPGRPGSTKSASSPSSHNSENPFTSHERSGSFDRSHEPVLPPTQRTSLSPPPPPNRYSPNEAETRAGEQYPISTNLFPQNSSTPPLSPTPPSPKRDVSDAMNTAQTMTPPQTKISPRSPLRKSSPNSPQVKESIEQPPTSVSSPSPHTGEKERVPTSPSSTSIDAVPHRPMSSGASVASAGSGSSQTAHYRTLTSTAAERKRTVAACRALRAQITRFEDAFIQLHGRPPKGAAERAPLATTYAQYREWKRAIRADAACRIQALFRGASTRWMLVRSKNPKMKRVVMAKAGRSSFSQASDRPRGNNQETVLKQLSIPAEIGEPSDMQKFHTISGSSATRSSPGESNILFQSGGSMGTQQSLPPQWSNHNDIVRRRTGGNDPFSGSPIPKGYPPSPVGSSASSVASSSSAELAGFSLSELQARKRELKQQLKQYDMNFARKHGRMPVKAEKEPIRHLYEDYNALKSQITQMEQENRQMASPIAMQQASAMLSQRTVSPTSSGHESDESPHSRRLNSRKPKAPPLANTPPSASTPAGSSSQDLAALKAEKGKLHQMLRSYEKDFFKEHKRQVSSFADIKPVASQYRRYKEIKKAIAALQQAGEK